MVKSLSFVELDFVAVKKVVDDASGLALTSIVTPDAGIAEVMDTFKGNVGPGAGSSVVPLAGVVVTARVASVEQVSVFFFLQKGIATSTTITATQGNNVFFIVNKFCCIYNV